MKSIPVRKIRDLTLTSEESGKNYVYSASGLVRIGHQIYVVADDNLHLALFDLETESPGTRIRLLPGELPADYKKRKKAKPDLESLLLIAPYAHAPNGALLAMPSLSRQERTTDILLPLDEEGGISEEVVLIDFSEIRKKLLLNRPGINIEGIIFDDRVKFLHRGSRKRGKSAIFEFDRSMFMRAIHDTHKPGADCFLGVKSYELGTINGISLEFTDSVLTEDGQILFLATAEDTDNEYSDGATLGSALGLIDPAGCLGNIFRFEGREKFEGLTLAGNRVGDSLELLIVADTDDETKPSGLFTATIESEILFAQGNRVEK